MDGKKVVTPPANKLRSYVRTSASSTSNTWKSQRKCFQTCSRHDIKVCNETQQIIRSHRPCIIRRPVHPFSASDKPWARHFRLALFAWLEYRRIRCSCSTRLSSSGSTQVSSPYVRFQCDRQSSTATTRRRWTWWGQQPVCFSDSTCLHHNILYLFLVPSTRRRSALSTFWSSSHQRGGYWAIVTDQ